MSLKINFFPLHFIISILVLITCVIVFSDTVYVYMSSNIYINGLIISLFIFCMIWILGVLSYYSRSAKVINSLFATVVPSGGDGDKKGPSMYVASSIAGTLIDNPVASKVLSTFAKTGKLEVSYSDAIIIVDSVYENGDRVLGPSRFLSSLFTMLGLFGTFVGLLATIDGVGNALNSLSDGDNVDIFGLVGLLADPLKGMSVAFSTSLFGLVAALFGNYGNYVAAQQLAVFVNKLKNFLTATTGMAAVDPAEIKAEDILLALEDSFNKLSMTFSEKLDVVSEGLFAMSKVIARGQDRQEKLSKAMLINLVKMVELADKLNILESLASDMSEILEENRIELFKYLDSNVISNLVAILNSSDLANKISADQIELSEKASVIVEDLAGMMENLVGITESGNLSASDKSDIINNSINANGDLLADILDSSDECLAILESVDDKTTGIDYTSNFEEVVNSIIEGNNLASELNNLSDEANSLADTLINTVATEDSLTATIGSIEDVNVAVDDVIGELETHRGILNNTLDAFNDVGDVVNDNLSKIINLNDSILLEVADANPIYKDILDEAIKSNELSTDILNTSSDSLAELTKSNELSTDILNISSDSLVELTKSNEISTDILNTASDSLVELTKSNELSTDILNTSSDSLDELTKSNELSTDILNTSSDSLDELTKSNELSTDILNISSDSLASLNSSELSLLSIRDTSENSSNSLLEINSNILSSIDVMDKLSDFSAQALEEMFFLRDTMEVFKNNMSLSNDYLATAINVYEESLNKLTSIDEILSEQLPVIYNLEKYADSLLTTSEQATSFIEGLKYNLENITNGFSMFLPLMTDVMSVVRDEMSTLNSMVSLLGNNVYDMAQGLQYNAETMGVLGEIVSVLDGRMENLDYSTTSLNETMQQLLPAMYENIEVSSSNSQYLAQLIGTLDYIAQTAENIGQSVSDFANTVLQENAYISEQVSIVSATVMDSTDRITQSLGETSYTIMEASNQIANAADLSTNVASNNSMAAEAMMSVVSDFAQLRDMYSDQMTEVSQLLSETINSVLSATDYVSSNMVDLNNLVSQIESYSYDVMSTQDNIRESIQNMLGVHEYMANAQDNFLNSLTDGVNYTASMLADGMSSVIERLDNVNMLTEVQTSKLDNLDYRLSELPETVSQMFMGIGDMFNNMQNMVYEIVSQNSQAQSALMEAISDNRDSNDIVRESNSMVMEMVNQTAGIQSVVADLVAQSSYANNMVGELSSQTESLQSSINGLTDSFSGVYGSMMDTSSNIETVANSLFSIAGEMATQVDALERNSIISSNLSNDLQSLAFSNESLRDVGNSLASIVYSFENLSSVLAGVQASSDNMDRTFANYSEMLFGEIANLTQTLNSHLDTFMSKDVTLGQDMFNIMNNVLSAVGDISYAINTFENLASNSIVANNDVKNQLETSMNYAISEISSIKENLGNNISERIIYEISQVSNNQFEMLDRLSSVMPQVNNLIDILSSNSVNSFGQNRPLNNNTDGVVGALMALREEHQNGNARLDIMANAVDTLITEILNSRDVAETILDVVTRMAGLTRN